MPQLARRVLGKLLAPLRCLRSLILARAGLCWPEAELAPASPPQSPPDPLGLWEREHDLGSAAEPIDPDTVPTPVTGPPATFDPRSIDLTGIEPMDPDASPTIPDGRKPASSHPPGRRRPRR